MAPRQSIPLDRRSWAALTIAAAALVLVAVFDMGTSLPLSYEVFLRWSAQRLAAGHGLRLWPALAFWALPQIGLGATTALAHLDPRVMRLVVLPFLVGAGWGESSLARQLGADRWWAGVAGLVLVCSPLTLALTTGFTSDVPYVALLVLAAGYGLRWVREGKSAGACVCWILVAYAQRQYGAGMLVAVGGGLLVMQFGGRRPVRAREWAWLGLAAALVAAIGAVLALTGVSTPDSARYLREFSTPAVASVVWALVLLPLMITLVALPMLLPLALTSLRIPTYRQMWMPAIGVLSLVGCGLILAGVAGPQGSHSIFPGDWLGPRGIGPAHLPGSKPNLFGPGVYIGVELATIAVMLLAFAGRADVWSLGATGVAAVYLALLAATQLPAIYMDAIIDRHFLPEAALALPVLAAALTRAGFPHTWLMRRLHYLVLGLSVLELGAFAVGEQEFQAWMSAAGAASSMEMALAPACQVDAGPLTAELFDIPYFERTGRLPDDPRPAAVYLAFASPEDSEMGSSYNSLAPGRIVIRYTTPARLTPPSSSNSTRAVC